MTMTPGVISGRTVTPRRIFQSREKQDPIVIPVLLDKDAAYDGGQASGYREYIRGGCFLAYDSASGLWAPVKRTKVNGAVSADTAIVVDNATHFKAGDSVLIGGEAAVAINSINYTTNTFTMASAMTVLDNSPVRVAKYATARAMLIDDEVSLWKPDKSAVQNSQGRAVFAGYFDQDKILGDFAAILEDHDSAYFVRNMVFDDYQLGVDADPQFAGFGQMGMFRRVVEIDGNYTVLAADSGTLFVATAAANLTLPTKAAGLWFGVVTVANVDVAVLSASSADDIIATNDVAADSVTFSTANEKVGSAALIFIKPDLLKWICINIGNTTATVA